LFAGATISGAAKVQLLLDLGALATRALRRARAPQRVRIPPAQHPLRLLVVDDSRSVREALSAMLAGAGYRVETASDGWEAWEVLQDSTFDLVLTDLEMPRLSGYDLITKIRTDAELRDLPIVVVSSQTSPNSRTRAQAAGAAYLVAKPVDRATLEA